MGQVPVTHPNMLIKEMSSGEGQRKICSVATLGRTFEKGSSDPTSIFMVQALG
jgi:hypothetical protein